MSIKKIAMFLKTLLQVFFRLKHVQRPNDALRLKTCITSMDWDVQGESKGGPEMQNASRCKT